MDKMLAEFFRLERWEQAIEIAEQKGINKGDLRALMDPRVRVQLFDAIVSDNYKIAPPHQVQIPKDDYEIVDGKRVQKFRTVYVNENVDRIFLSIANEILMDWCGSLIDVACKSYQKGIGCGKVVQELSKRIQKTNGWKSDLSKYFDSVPIEWIDKEFDRYEKICGKSKILDIIRDYYHTDLCFDPDGNLIEQYQSLKQGCAVASILADTLLSDMDKTLREMDGYYVRYSDDCLFIGKDYKEAMWRMRQMLAEKELTLNPKKVEWLNEKKWFKFLGFEIKGTQITLSKSRIKSFQKEIEKRSIKRKTKNCIPAVVGYLYYGDGQYSWATSVLPIINVDEDIEILNNYVMDAIRACQTGYKHIGGLGSDLTQETHVISRGTGNRSNVKRNKQLTPKEISGYYSIKCMQNALLTDRNAYECLVRQML